MKKNPESLRFIQTRVAESVAKILDERTAEEGISIADYLRRLVLRDVKEVKS